MRPVLELVSELKVTAAGAGGICDDEQQTTAGLILNRVKRIEALLGGNPHPPIGKQPLKELVQEIRTLLSERYKDTRCPELEKAENLAKELETSLFGHEANTTQ